jgi:hypothetical protein
MSLCHLKLTVWAHIHLISDVDLNILCFRLDPDILVGYEIQMLSWGYLLQRGASLNINICARISRLPGKYSNIHVVIC